MFIKVVAHVIAFRNLYLVKSVNLRACCSVKV